MDLAPLAELLAPHGLCILGETSEENTTLALIGPNEPHFWPIFESSPEHHDGAPDPMDRWSRRVLEAVADGIGGETVFPFGGPPFAPFYTWALNSGRAWASPIGFLVHDTAGLFVSFRGAVRLQGTAAKPIVQSPCKDCDKPCMTACPVGAFDDGYDVATCKAHVRSPEGIACRTTGCLARQACPVGQGQRLPAQAAFHMEAFL